MRGATSSGTTPRGVSGEEAASRWVRGMFGRIASRYDLLNHLLSFNLDKRWRARMVQRVADVLKRPGARVLDLCCGTGDVLLSLEARGGSAVMGSDFCHPMLLEARRKISSRGMRSPLFEADALALPLREDSIDLITVAFGFRNLANYRSGLTELARVLKPGGVLAILEFSQPPNRAFGALYGFFFNARFAVGGRDGLRLTRGVFVSAGVDPKIPRGARAGGSDARGWFQGCGVRTTDMRGGGAAYWAEVGVLAPTLLTDQRHKAATSQRPCKNLPVLFLYEIQFLIQAVAHGNHEPSGIAQLIEKRGGNFRRARRHRDRVKGRLRRVSERAVAAHRGDIFATAGVIEICTRQCRQLGDALDRNHAPSQPPEHRRVVTRAGANVQDFLASVEPQRLRHQRGHVGLRDGLAVADWNGRVGIRAMAVSRGDKFLARNQQHCIQHALIPNPALAQLLLDHFNRGGLDRRRFDRDGLAHLNLFLYWKSMPNKPLASRTARADHWRFRSHWTWTICSWVRLRFVM